MHKDWCGQKPCGECEKAMNNQCALDLSLPCSPSCEKLGEDGYPINWKDCMESGCDAYEWLEVDFEGEDE